MDRLFASYHMGNYVAIRGEPGKKIFESMPIYVRVGMHLLFYKSQEQSFLRYKSVEDLLKTMSVRQGKATMTSPIHRLFCSIFRASSAPTRSIQAS